MPAVKKSISIPDRLYTQAEKRMEELAFESLSDYVQHLIRNDIHDTTAPHDRYRTPDDPSRYLLNEAPAKSPAGDTASALLRRAAEAIESERGLDNKTS